MSKFKKTFIGKGTKVENMDIVRLSLKVEQVLALKHEFEGCDYITFEVAKLQQPDRFGRSHTAYVSVKEEVGDESPKKLQRNELLSLGLPGDFFFSQFANLTILLSYNLTKI